MKFYGTLRLNVFFVILILLYSPFYFCCQSYFYTGINSIKEQMKTLVLKGLQSHV